MEIGIGDVKMPAPPSSSSDDLEKRIGDVLRVEVGIVTISMVALGILVNAISSFNQTNIGLAQVGIIPKLCQYIPLAPTFRNFIFIVMADVGSLSIGLFSRIITGKQAKRKRALSSLHRFRPRSRVVKNRRVYPKDALVAF